MRRNTFRDEAYNEGLAEALQIAKEKQNNSIVHLIESLVDVDLTDDETRLPLYTTGNIQIYI